jgi:hypothetical protein
MIGTAPAARPPATVPEERSLWKLACLTAPLVCLLVVIQHFDLESKAFFRLFAITVAGFVVQYFLPLKTRLWFFVLLSGGALTWILGVERALWIAGLGGVLIGICHLPVAFWLRVGLLIGAGAALASFRGGWVAAGIPPAIWPILGSMFMFRLAVYMYDLKHDRSLATPSRTLAYFLLLPNVCFPLFPVVDFKTFCRYYFNADRHEIHMVGVQWIYRGIVQLILYRLVYQTLVTTPESVETVADLGQYLLWPYLLYLRVSGQFHIIVGILRLFGFNLPETHHSYYLASSFTDFWRRINIYWKDFMMKLFYYPAFFVLRKRGETLALVLSTLLVFAVTWALHSYQTFWIQGFFLLAWHDALFWAVLAAFVVVNALIEWKRGRQRRLTARALSWPQTWRLAGQTLAMFAAMCVLWSMWSTESLSSWLSLWSAAGVAPKAGDGVALSLLAFVPCAVILATIAHARSWSIPTLQTFEMRAAVPVVASAAVVFGTTSMVYKRVGEPGAVLSALRFGGLNQADAVELERGYYENLMGVDRFNGQLWDLYQNRPPDWQRTLLEAGLARPTAGVEEYELLPSAEGRFKGATLRTNRWGMHDKDYQLAPPPGCHRIALLGASHTMGSGVPREETFEARLEQQLAEREPRRCVEILNFAVYGYSPIAQLDVLRRRAARFHPQALLYVGHPGDARRLTQFVARRAATGLALSDPALDAMVARAGIHADSGARRATQRLETFGPEILSWLLETMAQECRTRNIAPGYVFLPMVPEAGLQGDPAQLELARQAGFEVFDLSDVYTGHRRDSLWIAEWDAHPNSTGHALIATRLYQMLESSSVIPGGSRHTDNVRKVGNFVSR